ncbi:hypothetical protein CFB52_029215 [Burkholderia sp. AU18528]|nr:hypothetical protein CFB52_029215 [Burkholderia sp. AU18528]RQV77687.1 hypothetical protein DF160_23760 [Burkholderia anthina]
MPCTRPERHRIAALHRDPFTRITSHHFISLRRSGSTVHKPRLDRRHAGPLRRHALDEPATAPVAMLARVYRGMTGETSFTPPGDLKHGAMSEFT